MELKDYIKYNEYLSSRVDQYLGLFSEYSYEYFVYADYIEEGNLLVTVKDGSYGSEGYYERKIPLDIINMNEEEFVNYKEDFKKALEVKQQEKINEQKRQLEFNRKQRIKDLETELQTLKSVVKTK